MVHFSQAVKLAISETSGQVAGMTIYQIQITRRRIAQAFRNVERTLATAGVRVGVLSTPNSYCIGGFPPDDEMSSYFMTAQPCPIGQR